MSPAEWVIVATDYIHYAIVYQCNDAYHVPATVFILAKNIASITDPTTVAKVTLAIRSAKHFNFDWLQPIY
mgnify:CR=1 FL=1